MKKDSNIRCLAVKRGICLGGQDSRGPPGSTTVSYFLALTDFGTDGDLVKDIVLGIFTQERQSSIRDVALVCCPWHSIVSENLTQILIHKRNGDLPGALSLALPRKQVRAFNVAIELVLRSMSLDDSNQSLLLVSHHGRPDLAMLLLTAPHYAAHADYSQDGEALVNAACRGHSEVMLLLPDAK
eukprot:gene27104-biopygen857